MLKTRKILSVLLLIVMIAGTLTGCKKEKTNSFETMEDFAQAKIGIMNGSSFDTLAKEYLPEAECYYMNVPDLFLSLKQEKIEGILMDMGFLTPFVWEGEPLSYIKMDMPATEYAVALPKTENAKALKAQIDAFIDTQTQNGWLAELTLRFRQFGQEFGHLIVMKK